MRLSEKLVALDLMFPPCGPCLICGGTDKRHRLWDAIECSVRMDGLAFAMKDYDVSKREALALADAFAHARRRHVLLPGRYPLPVNA